MRTRMLSASTAALALLLAVLGAVGVLTTATGAEAQAGHAVWWPAGPGQTTPTPTASATPIGEGAGCVVVSIEVSDPGSTQTSPYSPTLEVRLRDDPQEQSPDRIGFTTAGIVTFTNVVTDQVYHVSVPNPPPTYTLLTPSSWDTSVTVVEGCGSAQNRVVFLIERTVPTATSTATATPTAPPDTPSPTPTATPTPVLTLDPPTADIPTATSTPSGTCLNITGVLRDSDGPLVGERVSVWDATESPREEDADITDGDGRFDLTVAAHLAGRDLQLGLGPADRPAGYTSLSTGGWFVSVTGQCDYTLLLVAAPTATPTPPPAATGTPTPFPTLRPGEAAQPCPFILNRVPPAVISDRLANPWQVSGFYQLRDPGKPEGPGNARQLRLSVRNIAVPWDPVGNPLVYKVGCP